MQAVGNVGLPGHMMSVLLPGAGEAAAGPIGMMLGSAVGAARYGAGAATSRGSSMVMDGLVNRMTNPEAYQKAVNPLVNAAGSGR